MSLRFRTLAKTLFVFLGTGTVLAILAKTWMPLSVMAVMSLVLILGWALANSSDPPTPPPFQDFDNR
jgi:hypothetical protein